MMHGRTKSDSEKPNKAGATSCEVGGAKGGGPTGHAPGTGPGKRVPGVGPHTTRRQVATRRKTEKFTALLHHIRAEHLEAAFFELKGNATPGVDGLTWSIEAALDCNHADLHGSI
jgi:RNA-directed DNA polymerase